MLIYFRVDASISIGSGHLMRCLALAEALRKYEGVECIFISREMKGHLFSVVEERGFHLIKLSSVSAGNKIFDLNTPHSEWLEVHWRSDVEEVLSYLTHGADWLIVDHYAIDAAWQNEVMPYVNKIMVIDDLADRNHDCDVLLDQNFNSQGELRYKDKVNHSTKFLMGPKYSLLRDEFCELRKGSLDRRNSIDLNNLLICMGAGDIGNETLVALNGALKFKKNWGHIDIVVSADYSYVKEMLNEIKDYSFCELHIQTKRMGELMLNADFAITAGGGITWEKCCLGLPSMAVVLAENQRELVKNVSAIGAMLSLNKEKKTKICDYADGISSLDETSMLTMSQVARNLCDGSGAGYVAEQIMRHAKNK